MIDTAHTAPASYKSNRPYQVCTRCVMDTSDPLITFNEEGVCSNCDIYADKASRMLYTGQAAQIRLDKWVGKIKEAGKGQQYDSILGLSGGVDSSYVALKAKEMGLRPLAVHFDNSWNSELAVKNIENIVSRLDIDLYTLVVNWEEFKDLQLSYIRAGVIDIEVCSDHAILATMYKLAREHKIKYILPGANVVTEGILSKGWIFPKMDNVNLRAIHKTYGTIPLKTYPQLTMWDYIKTFNIHNIQAFPMLNCMPYNKDEAKKEMAEKLGWRDYGGKHYESIFTKFYQAYILPQKFGVDKRRAHLATLINSGQITREEALKELEKPLYDPKELQADKEYVVKKFGLSMEEFDEIMRQDPVPHTAFPTDVKRKERYRKLISTVKKLIGR